MSATQQRLTNLISFGKGLGLFFRWIIRRTDYWIGLFLFWMINQTILGLWFDDSYAPPYLKVFVIGMSLLFVARCIHWEQEKERSKMSSNVWKYGGLQRDAFLVKDLTKGDPWRTYRMIFRSIFWTIFGLLWVVLIGGRWTTHLGIPTSYWTVTNKTGQILPETNYPYWDFGKNATDPITLDEQPTTDKHSHRTDSKEKLFRWSTFVIRQVVMEDLVCEIQIKSYSTCEPTYDNVKAQYEHPISKNLIEQAINSSYLEKVVEKARIHKSTCYLNQWIEVETTFDVTRINPKIRWKSKEFSCQYRFKPII